MILAGNKQTITDEMKILFSGNRPRVFLAYTNYDKGFIEGIEEDLYRCQIIPWLFSEELRADQPLSEIIFEYGISKCDALFVYITEDLIQSSLCKKDLTPEFIKLLLEHKITLHLYIKSDTLREKVPPLLRTYPIKLWCEENHQDVLPIFISSIWHSFQIRAIISAINEEKLHRTELQLELAKLTKPVEEGVFSERERADFQYIWDRLDRHEPVVLSILTSLGNIEKATGSFKFFFHLQNLFTHLDRIMEKEYDSDLFFQFLNDFFQDKIPPKLDHQKEQKTVCSEAPAILSELLMYAFLERADKVQTVNIPALTGQSLKHRIAVRYVFSEKYYRFKYWLLHQRKLEDELKWYAEKPDLNGVI